MAQMGDHEAAEREDDTAPQSRQAPNPQDAQTERHAPRRHEEVAHRQQLQRPVSERSSHEPRQQVGGIEKSILYVGGEGAAGKEVRVPERQDATLQAAGSEVMGGPKKRGQIAAADRHEAVRQEQQLPEEAS